jgi:hypothetical protein
VESNFPFNNNAQRDSPPQWHDNNFLWKHQTVSASTEAANGRKTLIFRKAGVPMNTMLNVYLSIILSVRNPDDRDWR